MKRESGGWCILRTSGRHTLPLAESLAEAGLETWTPSELERYPGKRARRRVPIMPTFVFANACHLWTLVDMAEKPDAGFSVFRYLDRFPVIADDDLDGLRDAENDAVPRAERPAYEIGAPVQTTAGSYCGIPGTVLRCKGGEALVLFGWHRVRICTWLLKPNGLISAAEVERAPRHRNAAKYLGR